MKKEINKVRNTRLMFGTEWSLMYLKWFKRPEDTEEERLIMNMHSSWGRKLWDRKLQSGEDAEIKSGCSL